MTKYNRPNGKLFGSSANNIGVFGSGQAGETYTTTTDPNTANSLGTHWEEGWDGAVVSQAPYTAPFIEDMNAVNYVNSYNSAYLLQRGIPEYDANEEYQADSVCTYNGEIWICLQDATTGITPTEGANWHAQTEVPVMSDNEILVGQTGVGATKTDTLNQGDIVASTSGLNIKTGVIVNADISAGANIDESKINLAYDTTTLNTAIGNVSGSLTTHTSDHNNPHSTSLDNLTDTNLSTPNADDTLVYDGVNSEWINQENSLDNLSNATITTPSNKDVLWYSGGSWVNTPDVNNHIVSKVNPHETEFANLHDANISTPSDQDTVVYDNNSSKWINQPNTVENLKNANISTPSNGQILSYDSGNSEWINTTNSIDNLSDTAISSANYGDTLFFDGYDWVNQPYSLEDLSDTAVGTATLGDTLFYDGNAWFSQQNSVSNLTDTTITSAGAGDILAYDNLNSKWINQQNSVDNLSDTTISTLTSGDVLSYDGSKWINSQPAGGSLSNLTDTTITTPSDKQLLQYDYANSKWVNSSDVWNRIEVNDIAYVNSASSNIALTSTDKRHQIFTSTSGFTITLPSTGIKSGESFIFEWSNPEISSTFTINASDNSNLMYVSTGMCREIFTAKVDNPATSTDWIHQWSVINRQVKSGSSNALSWTSVAGSRVEKTSSTLFTLSPGLWKLDFNGNIILTGGSLSNITVMGLITSWGAITMRNVSTTFTNGYSSNIPLGSGSSYYIFGNTSNAWIYGNIVSSGIFRCVTYSTAIWGGLSIVVSTAGTHYAVYTAHATFIAPVSVNI